MSELKPCPFCGGKAEFERKGTHRVSCIVNCTDCGASMESNEVGEISGAFWNDRVEDKRIAELEEVILVLTHCDETGYIDGKGFIEGFDKISQKGKDLLDTLKLEQQAKGIESLIEKCTHCFDSWENVKFHDLGISQTELKDFAEELRQKAKELKNE